MIICKYLIIINSTLIAALSNVSCSFCTQTEGEICSLLADHQSKEVIASNHSVIFEEPGTVIAIHGFACAESRNQDIQDYIQVDQSFDLPVYVTNATVLLNGWRFEYLNTDHKVASFGTVIKNISLERNTLKWRALGVLSDRNFDDPYHWCYHFTIIGWNQTNFNMVVDHNDGKCDSITAEEANFFAAVNKYTTTALASFPTFLQNPLFSTVRKTGVFPRGFGFRWNSCIDYSILQIAYNLGCSENYVQNKDKYYEINYKKLINKDIKPFTDSASHVNRQFISWQSSAIMKDNEGRREFEFGEVVSGLGGDDIGIIEEPFSILPIEDHGEPCYGSSGTDSIEHVVKEIPFQYVIPVLSGWDMGYGEPISGCNAEHIKAAGIWIDNWKYNSPGDPAGTLRYKISSHFKDRNGDPASYRRHKITILGIRAVNRDPTGVK